MGFRSGGGGGGGREVGGEGEGILSPHESRWCIVLCAIQLCKHAFPLFLNSLQYSCSICLTEIAILGSEIKLNYPSQHSEHDFSGFE